MTPNTNFDLTNADFREIMAANICHFHYFFVPLQTKIMP